MMGLNSILEIETPEIDTSVENNQNEFLNTVDNFLNQIGKDSTIDETEKITIENKFDDKFFQDLQDGLHPDEALQLKNTIEKINNYKDNEQLNKLYDFILKICNSFNYTEHNINNSFNIDTAPAGVIRQLNTLINGNGKEFKGLAELNAIVNDEDLSPLITAVKGILNGKTISGNVLVNIANFLHIDTRQKDEKYNKEWRLNNLGKEVFGTDKNSLLQYLNSKYEPILKQYQEQLIPTTFNNDVLLENIFLKNSPTYTPDSGKIEFRENGNEKALGIFDQNGNLIRGTRTTKTIEKIDGEDQIYGGGLYLYESGIFTSGILSEGIKFCKNGSSHEIRVGKFKDDGFGIDTGISIDIHKHIKLTSIENELEDVDITTYSYNKETNQIEINYENNGNEGKITIDNNGNVVPGGLSNGKFKTTFDYLLQNDPLNTISNKPIITNGNTIFQNFCINNGINFDTTLQNIEIENTNILQENTNILNDLNIIDTLNIEKIEPLSDKDKNINEFNMKISHDFIFYNSIGDIALVRFRIKDNKIQSLNTDGERENFDMIENIITLRSENYDKFSFIKTMDTEEIRKIIIDNNLEQKRINEINTLINGPTSPDGGGDQDGGGNIDNTSITQEIQDPQSSEITQEQEIPFENLTLDNDSINTFFSQKHITKQNLVDFFNIAKNQEDLSDDQKTLLRLMHTGLTTERKKEEGNEAYEAVKKLQQNLKFTGTNIDGKFGINTFKKLKNKFPQSQNPIDATVNQNPAGSQANGGSVETGQGSLGGQESIETHQTITINDYSDLLEKMRNIGNKTLEYSIGNDIKISFTKDGCVFKENNNEIRFKKEGNIYKEKNPNGIQKTLEVTNTGIVIKDTNNFAQIYYKTGHKFEGKLNDQGKPKEGKMLYPNNEIYEGTFIIKDGVVLKKEGKATYNNGSSFEGTFYENGKPKEGKATYNNGSSFEGTFYENGIRKLGIDSYNGSQRIRSFESDGRSLGLNITNNKYCFCGWSKDGYENIGTFLHYDYTNMDSYIKTEDGIVFYGKKGDGTEVSLQIDKEGIIMYGTGRTRSEKRDRQKELGKLIYKTLPSV